MSTSTLVSLYPTRGTLAMFYNVLLFPRNVHGVPHTLTCLLNVLPQTRKSHSLASLREVLMMCTPKLPMSVTLSSLHRRLPLPRPLHKTLRRKCLRRSSMCPLRSHRLRWPEGGTRWQPAAARRPLAGRLRPRLTSPHRCPRLPHSQRATPLLRQSINVAGRRRRLGMKPSTTQQGPR